MSEQNLQFPIGDIFIATCRRLNQSPGKVMKGARDEELTYARHMSMVLMLHYSDQKPSDIAAYFQMDRTCVNHASKAMESRLLTSPEKTEADIRAVVNILVG